MDDNKVASPMVLSAASEMTIYGAERIQRGLLAAIEAHPAVDIDLSGVEEIDSAGVQLLIAAKRQAMAAGKTLRLVRHSPAVIEIFGLFNVSAFFGDPVVIAAAEPNCVKRGCQA